MTNYFFFLLPAAYIFAIFYFADSAVASQIAVFNLFSLLHIPLYGFLTLLLVLALGPRSATNPKIGYTMATLIAIAVAILDEFYQSYIPNREGSITDVLLDVLGIMLALFLSLRGPFSHWTVRFGGLTRYD